MPAMNGLELVSALRGRGVSIPAILITGNPTKYVRDRAAAIAVLVVEKPQLASYLLDCVRDVCARRTHGRRDYRCGLKAGFPRTAAIGAKPPFTYVSGRS